MQTQNEQVFTNQRDEIAHKLALIGKVLSVGFDKAIRHLYGEDYDFLKEIETKDINKIKDDLHKRLLQM